MSLSILGHIYIGGKILHKRKRFDSIIEAQKEKQPADIIAQNPTSVFILNPINT
ncbi:MAG: hypothetical protein QM503_10585 [Bacteroidota bacterium]